MLRRQVAVGGSGGWRVGEIAGDGEDRRRECWRSGGWRGRGRRGTSLDPGGRRRWRGASAGVGARRRRQAPHARPWVQGDGRRFRCHWHRGESLRINGLAGFVSSLRFVGRGWCCHPRGIFGGSRRPWAVAWRSVGAGKAGEGHAVAEGQSGQPRFRGRAVRSRHGRGGDGRRLCQNGGDGGLLRRRGRSGWRPGPGRQVRWLHDPGAGLQRMDGTVRRDGDQLGAGEGVGLVTIP